VVFPGGVGDGYRLRTQSHLAGDGTIAGRPRPSFDKVRSKHIDACLITADLGGPKILDLLRMLARVQHAPAVDAQLAVGKRNRSQFHAHAVKPGNKGCNVKVRHFRFPLKRYQTFCAA